jgi:hypothetical protein
MRPFVCSGLLAFLPRRVALNYWKVLLVFVASAGLAVVSCSHPSGTGMTGSGGSNGSGGFGDCPAGSVGCECIATTCDQGLSCADLGGGKTECVTTSGSTGGTPGTGGSVATGGTPGTGGTVGAGGSPATGGSPGSGGNGPGTGGTPATGGSPGTGGSPADNLIINGDFSQSDTNWGVPNGSPTTKGVQNGQYCITLNSGSGQVILGWGGTAVSANLSANVNYTLSFQASASSSLSGFDTHVGSAVSVGGSYPLDKDVGNDTIGTSLQTFTHMFSLTSADPQAGVAFLISVSSGNSTVCVDNVTLTAN